MATDNENLPVAVGDVLAGKYRVERVLGVGGMGIVVSAKHVQLEQLVALKFLLAASLGSPEAVERFLREAKAAVRLKSEHVAKVTDVGTLESGAPYMVMEFLEGADLSDVVRMGGRLSIVEAVSFVLQASEAIAEAHSLGIVHRDLKPQNLFVTRRVDGRPLIKVLDFGISKSVDPKAMSLTRTSSIMGSPLYMSPEQMRSTKTVDTRADIWALGVILYELLVGRVPFEAEAVPELCLKVVQDEPDAPMSLRPEIPQDLNDAVLKCLAKRPDERFQNIAELAVALEPHAEDLARGSADRIASTLRVVSSPPGVLSTTGSRVKVNTNPGAKVGTGGTAWGATQPFATGMPRRSKTPLYVGLGGAGALAAGLVLFFATRHDPPKPDALAAPPVTAPPVVTSTTPVVTSTPVLPAQPSALAPLPATPDSARPATSTAPAHSAKTPSSATSAKKDAAAAAPTVTAPPRTFE